MRFKYRLKTYRNEDGEFTEYFSGDKDSILAIIGSHWMDDDVSSDLEIISIINKTGQFLLFEHQGKGVFDVYYLPLETNFHYHKKSRIEIVYQSLELFVMNEINALELYLNKTKKENKYIRGNFFYVDHDYSLNDKRNLNELIWIFWGGLPMGLTFTIPGLVFLLKFPVILLPIPLLLIALGTYFWLPGVLLHQQYTRDAEDLVVRVTKGSKTMTIKTSSTTKALNKSQILTVTKYQNPAYKNPWSGYGFTEIIFETGDVINLTNLMIDQSFILDKFSLDSVESKTVNKMIPKLRKKSLVK